MMVFVFRFLFFIIGLSLSADYVQGQVVESVPQAMAVLADELMLESRKQGRRAPLTVVLDILNDQTTTRDSLSRQVESLFSKILADKGELPVVEFAQTQATREEWMEAFPDSTSDQIQGDLADILGADWIVTGSFRKADSMVEFRLQLYEILTQQVIWRGQAQAVFQEPKPQMLSEESSVSDIFPDAEKGISEGGGVVSSAGVDETEEDRSAAGLVEEDRAADTTEMVLITEGVFEMGSFKGEEDERPLHSVHLNSYYIDSHEVTNEEYTACRKCERGKGGFDTTSPKQPVVYVDWENANKYCRFVGKRLPTEAEWEKAARADSKTEYVFGDSAEQLGDYAWYEENTRQEPYAHVIGLKKKNAWGLYDMKGNVMEWVQDWYDPQQYQNSEKENPKGPKDPKNPEYPLRVVRGGAWGGTFGTGTAQKLRSGERFAQAPWVRSFLLGFRCAADAENDAFNFEIDFFQDLE
ncbi:MAG: formylglycine-generating enzyme family protein [SAR324 cluster bacterium]|nr:formylglycine-generating enzyme family protein [SAR324 cluster bacterium]